MTKNKTIISFSLSKEAIDMLDKLHKGTGNNSRSRSLETIIEYTYNMRVAKNVLESRRDDIEPHGYAYDYDMGRRAGLDIALDIIETLKSSQMKEVNNNGTTSET